MAYRSDLYRFDKIIGYTGQLHRLPTVYFRCDRLGVFGRITQQHKLPFNVGRGRVESTRGYEMRNVNINGRQVLKEFRNGRCVHTSRNAFIPLHRGNDPHMIHGVNEATLGILAQALRRCPDAKTSVTYDRWDMMDVHCAIQQKRNMLNELSTHIQVFGDMRPSSIRRGQNILDRFVANDTVFNAHQAATARRA